MSFTISKSFSFSASHRLPSLPSGHKCSRLHGHNYVVDIEVSADSVDSHSMVLDFGRLDVVKDWIDTTLDHQHLNEVLPVEPTSEMLAYTVWKEVCRLVPELGVSLRVSSADRLTVTVHETDKTWARYSA